MGLPIEVVQTDGTKLVVVQRTDLDLANGDSKARRLAYADNQASAIGLDWNAEQIAADLEAGVDLDSMFRKDELDEILKDITPEPDDPPEPQIDRAEELREKWKTERGQVWEIGKHRLMCGDCTDPDDYNDFRFRGHAEPNSLVTDPPYGIGESNEKNMSRGKLAAPTNYGHYDWDASKIDDESLLAIREKFKFQIIFGGNYYKLPPSQCWLIWDKDNGSSDFADVEMAWTNIDKAARIFKWRWQGMLQEPGHPKTVREHPTQKPAQLLAWCIEKTDGDIYDPFIGSGTTMVAAEQLGRVCYGMEIEPKYVAVALERMADMGLDPVLTNG